MFSIRAYNDSVDLQLINHLIGFIQRRRGMVRILLLALFIGVGVSACSKEDVDKAGEMASDVVDDTKVMGEAAMDKGAEMVDDDKEMASDAVDATMEKGAEMVDEGKEMANDATMEKGAEMVDEGKEMVKDAVEH